MTTVNRPVLLLGREPAQLLGLFSASVMLFSAVLFPLTEAQQGALNAAAVAIAGIIGAFAVSAEKAAPLIAGLVQAVIALAVAFGADLTPEIQSTVMTFVAAVVAWWLRGQVVAPSAPEPTTR